MNLPDYNDWLRNLKIILQSEKIDYILNNPPPIAPAADASTEELENHDIASELYKDDNIIVRCYMLASMSDELQR